MAGTIELVTAIHPEAGWAAYTAGRPIVLYFFTPDCGACKAFHGRMTAVLSPLVLDGSLTLLEMNYEAELPRVLADQINISGFPTLAFVMDGDVKDLLVGASTKRDLQEWIRAMMTSVEKKP